MEITIKKQILENIGLVYEKAKDCKLKGSFLKSLESELNYLSQYFNTTEIQSFFIAVVFTTNYQGDTADLKNLSDYFNCNPLRMLEFYDVLEFLCMSGYLQKEKLRQSLKICGAGDKFAVEEKITEAILQGAPIPEVKKKTTTDIISFLEELYILGKKRNEDVISTVALFRETEVYLERNEHFTLVKKLKQFELKTEDNYLFLYLIWKTISGENSSDIGCALNGIYDQRQRSMEQMQKLINEEHTLIRLNLIEIVAADFFNDTELKLTDNALQILNESDLKFFTHKKKNNNIIEPSDIPFKKLIFDEKEMSQLKTLSKLLQHEKFIEIQQKLLQKDLSKGITFLMHGYPGTGKTEVVKQLAKSTNRRIMKVDISQTKSKWFGDSEKIVKRIFTDYKKFAKECEQTPILFFNEADAVICRRKEVDSSNVAQTENALQNIILEELENFDGILIATTNLAENIDSAFERRFLFKIHFEKPGSEVRAKIWKSKLADFKSFQCNTLAEKFNFSGGQIDNIIRKIDIQEIVHNRQVTFEDVELFCQEELLTKQASAIGFSHH